MQFTITDLCLCSDADYARLKRRTDACAKLGRSYEIPCTLPGTCTPTDVFLGFCRADEQYLFYIHPQVCYNGANRTAAQLLAPGIRSFPNFLSLTEHLRQIGRALDTAQHNPQPPHLCYQITTALKQQILGQKDAVEAAAFRLYNHLSKSQPSRPLSLVLYGATGVGKSELAKAVAPTLRALRPQEKWHCVWTDLNTYTQAHSVSRLIGSPPGYIGYGDPPVLEAVREHPRTVFIFDELDKAHPEVLKIFMSILDEGRATAHRIAENGQLELDFRHCIFIFTTNLALSAPPKPALGFGSPTPTHAAAPIPSNSLPQYLLTQDENARRAMLRCGIPPEIACRFTGLIGFQSLDEAARLQITAQQISALGMEFGLHIVSVSPEIIAALTPRDAVSIRSTPAILEGVLTPVFSNHISRSNEISVHLSGTLDSITLTPVGRTLFSDKKNPAAGA